MTKAFSPETRNRAGGTAARRGLRPRLASVIAVVVLCAAVSGCVHAQARTMAAGPPLDVPAPPPRAVEPMAEPVAPLPSVPIDATAPATEPGEPTRNAAPRPGPPRPATAPHADEPVPADATKVPPGPPPPPAQTLQTTPTQQDAEVEAKIRAVLSRASSDLNRIDYARLNANLKDQYDQAKRFVSLSEDAMRAKNLVYAGTLADKAADLAAQLAGR